MKRFFTIFGLLTLIGWSGVSNAQWISNNPSCITNSQDVTNPTYLLDNDESNDCSIAIIEHTQQWGSVEITFAQETCLDSINYKWTKRDRFYDYSPGVASWFATQLYYYNEDSLDWILVVADTLDNSMDDGSVATHTGWSLKSFTPICATKFKFEIGGWWWWTNNITFSIHELYLHETSQASENCDFISNNTGWLNTSDITDASNILDNDQNTNGYLAMSDYSTTYTKSAEINFPSVKSISSFKFKYSFPATVESPCHGYPDQIAHTCKIMLYYDNGYGWQEAYTVTDNLNTIADPSICEVIDSAQFDFSDVIIAQNWKIEMIGQYFLGGGYQTTTYFKLFEVGFKECIESQDETMIIIPDTTVAINQQLNIPVLTTDVNSSDNIISYQFNLGYDSEMLQFIDANVSGTISEDGIVEVNSSTQGQLVVSYMTTTPLNGEGSILNLQFNPLQMGMTELVISDFLYNTIEITDTQNGFVTIIGEYGDVDTNSYVQAFDAALALQYSVGMDPLPIIDPLPWEAWRIVVADVDGENGVTQNDANLILQYSVGSISIFPIESKKQAQTKAVNFDVEIIGNEFVFTTIDELFGFNLYVTNNSSAVLGEPIILDENMLSATKIDSEVYNIGLCAAISPESETQIMKIPYTGELDDIISFNMFINNEFKAVTFGTNVINTDLTDKISIYPNPVSDELVIGIDGDSELLDFEILNSIGQVVHKGQIVQKVIVKTSDFAPGVYILKLENGKIFEFNKIIKK